MEKNAKTGFTLIELTVVLAILAVLAAILVPTFLVSSDRARLRGDVQTARIIENAIALHRVELGRMPPGNTTQAIIDSLVDAGYLPRGNVKPQTQHASWDWCQSNGLRVDIRQAQEGVRDALKNLTDEEKMYVLAN